MKFLLDNNVFGQVGKTNPHENVASWLRQVDDSDLALSVLTILEASKGIAKLKPRKPLEADEINVRTTDIIAAFGERILPVTKEIADLWGALLGESEKHIFDTGIAATARVHGLVVVTRNLDDYAGRGVATLDPFKKPPKINPP
jgi:predicted nucleic acid-binding protein